MAGKDCQPSLAQHRQLSRWQRVHQKVLGPGMQTCSHRAARVGDRGHGHGTLRDAGQPGGRPCGEAGLENVFANESLLAKRSRRVASQNSIWNLVP